MRSRGLTRSPCRTVSWAPSLGCTPAAFGSVPRMSDAAIVAEGLRRTFAETVAVDGIDLTVGHGEIYGFLGPNGAGKSTAVRILCTLLAPTSGRAIVAGHDVERAPGAVRLQIGVALQDAALDDQQTGRELLT